MAPTIIEYLISLGGVRDDMGDLRAMDLHRVNRGTFGRLAHNGRRAMSLDHAREVCEEAHYLRPGSTISDLLEAIRDQASGLSGLVPEDRPDEYLARAEARGDDLPDAFDPREILDDPLEITMVGELPADFAAWRSRMGWTQVRAAEELGLTRRTLIMYENGSATVPKAVRLACLALTLIHRR